MTKHRSLKPAQVGLESHPPYQHFSQLESPGLNDIRLRTFDFRLWTLDLDLAAGEGFEPSLLRSGRSVLPSYTIPQNISDRRFQIEELGFVLRALHACSI